MQSRAALFGACIAAAGAACSLTTDLGGLTGGSAGVPDGGTPAEAGSVVDAGVDAFDGGSEQEAGARGYRATVLADAPLAYYRFEDNGTTAKDETGAHDGTHKGVAARVAGAIASEPAGTAAFFDGASWVDVGDVLPFAGTAPFTIEAWASPVPGATDPMCMVAKTFAPGSATGGVAEGWTFYAEQGTNVLRLARFVGSNATGPAGPGIPNARFSHVVATYDGKAGAIYLNGALVDSAASTTQLGSTTDPLTIGSGRGGVYCYFRGALDEVALYGTALAAARIQAHYAAGIAK